MTVSTTTARSTGTTDGTTGPFTFSFQILSAIELTVYRGGVLLVQDTDYTVSSGPWATGGTITLTTAGSSGDALAFVRVTTETQTLDLATGDTMPAGAIELAHDKTMRILHEHTDEIQHALRAPISESPGSTDWNVPVAATRRGKYLLFADTAAALPEVGQLADASLVTLSQSVIGGLLYPETDAETAAGVTPSNLYCEPYDLLRYDASVDNSTDDGTAVRNWLLAAIQAGKPATYSGPAGTALCSTFTTIDTTSAIRINAPGLTIKGPSSATDFCRPGGNVDVRNVVFDRWNSVFEREDSDTGSITRLVLKDNTFQNCTGLVINIERPIDKYWIRGNKFSANTGGYNIRIGENTYASQDTWLKGWIVENDFETLTATGTTSLAAVIVYGKWVDISNNTIDGLNQTGTGECWGIYTKARYSRVTGNKINNVVADGSSDNVGINIKGSTRSETVSPQGFASIVTENQVTNIGVLGSKGSGIAARSDDVIVSDNFIEEPGLFGINADLTSSIFYNIQIAQNQVRYAAISGTTRGVAISGSGENISVENNTVLNAARGFSAIAGASANLDDVTFDNNVSEACTDGYMLGASTGGALRNCTVRDHRFKGTHTRGITNGGFGGTVSGTRITGNRFANATTPISGTFGNDTLYDDNDDAIETATGTFTASLFTRVTDLDSSGGAVTATCPDGLYDGQRKKFTMSDASNSSTVSVTSHLTSDPEVFTFAQITDVLILEWVAALAQWRTVFNNGVAT